jgi:hypothetical protein
VKKVPSPTRDQDYQVDDPCYDIGGGAPPIGIKVKKILHEVPQGIQVVSFQQYVVVCIKNARFKCQPSTPMQSFVSIRGIPFMKIDDKGGEIEIKI